jgi:hypothetical protein
MMTTAKMRMASSNQRAMPCGLIIRFRAQFSRMPRRNKKTRALSLRILAPVAGGGSAEFIPRPVRCNHLRMTAPPKSEMHACLVLRSVLPGTCSRLGTRDQIAVLQQDTKLRQYSPIHRSLWAGQNALNPNGRWRQPRIEPAIRGVGKGLGFMVWKCSVSRWLRGLAENHRVP